MYTLGQKPMVSLGKSSRNRWIFYISVSLPEVILRIYTGMILGVSPLSIS